MKRIALLALLALAPAACSDDDDGGAASTAIASTALPTSPPTVPPTQTVTIAPTPVSDAAALVEDCVAYVPVAIYFGNFYMKAIWDLGGGTTDGLRQVCESMVTTDPDGLRRMSAEFADLQNLTAGTTASGAVTTAAP